MTRFRWAFLLAVALSLAGAAWVSTRGTRRGDGPPERAAVERTAAPLPGPEPATAPPVTTASPAWPVLVAGRVLLPNGEPAAGAEVHLSNRETTVPPVEWRTPIPLGRRVPRLVPPVLTGAEGTFAFRSGPPTGDPRRPVPPDHWRVTAILGDAFAAADVEKPAEPPLRITDLRLAEGVRVRGRVLDPAGEPIAGVTAELLATRGQDSEWESHLLAAASGEDGRLDFLPLPRFGDWDFHLDLDHPDYPPTRVTVDTGDVLAGRPITAVLDEGCVLRGVVVREDESPVNGAQVVPVSHGIEDIFNGGTELPHRKGLTDATGRFEIRGVPPGRIHMLVYPDLTVPGESREAWGVFPHVSEVLEGRPGQSVDAGVMRLFPPGAIRGRAWDRDGGLLSNEKLYLATGVHGLYGGLALKHEFTDGEGAFTFPNLPPGRYAVLVRHSFNILDNSLDTVAEVEVRAGDATDVEVILPAGGR